MTGPADQPFPERLRELAAERGLSVERVWAMASNADSTGPSLSALRKTMAGKMRLQPHLMESMARALGVEPAEFVEYRLWRARRLLDEREVGLDEALANLQHVIGALRDAGLVPLEQAAQQAAQDAQRSRQQSDEEPRERRAKKRGGRG